MGADIRGAGTDTIKIHGVQKLRGATYSIIPDQIEAGTYMVAAAATHGDVLVKNVTPKHWSPSLPSWWKWVSPWRKGRHRAGGLRPPPAECNVKTMPHPGFPTDMQPQITALLSIAQGTSMVNESVWESNRFIYVDELRRMGAQITVDGKVAIVEGVDHLKAAPVRALDLRAGAAMVIAGWWQKAPPCWRTSSISTGAMRTLWKNWWTWERIFTAARSRNKPWIRSADDIITGLEAAAEDAAALLFCGKEGRVWQALPAVFPAVRGTAIT